MIEVCRGSLHVLADLGGLPGFLLGAVCFFAVLEEGVFGAGALLEDLLTGPGVMAGFEVFAVEEVVLVRVVSDNLWRF